MVRYENIMAKQRTLFLDESGKADFSHRSNHFILSACSIPDNKIKVYKELLDQIIFKYWGPKRSYKKKYGVGKIVLHAIDIAKCKGPFVILKDKQVNKFFWNDIYAQVLSQKDITYYLTLVDKDFISKNIPSWNKKTTLNKSYSEVLDAFIKHLTKSGMTGKIIAESSSDQDLTLVTVFNNFQRNSLQKYHSKYLVSKTLTSLSLVNKNNDGFGSQIADLIAWTGANKYLISENKKKLKDLNYSEQKILKMFNSRLKSKASRDKFTKFKVIKK